MKIRILTENTVYRRGLFGEHGLSLLIEANGKKILFDTGQSDVYIKNAKKLKETVEEIPLEKIVLETDCPYMAPEPHRGKRNSSLYLPHIIEKIAEIKGTTKEIVTQVTYDNAMRLFSSNDVRLK